MNKTELVIGLAQATGMSKRSAAQALEALVEIIIKSLEKDQEIKIIGFGTFKVSKVKAKMVVNPQNREKMQIEGYNKVRFIPGSALKNAVRRKQDKES